MGPKLLIVQIAAGGADLLDRLGRTTLADLPARRTRGVFPAVTCTAQASFRTATTPDGHGMVANGCYFRDLRKPMFWEQSAGLVGGRRFWSAARRRGRTVGMICWQQSMGEDVDILLTPAPIHKHHGGMIQDCYGRPGWLYDYLRKEIGSPLKLQHYWGPLASHKAGDWIARATAAVLAREDLRPDLCLTYLPTLDYDLQRFGPAGDRAAGALARLEDQLARLAGAAHRFGYEMLLFGDYAIADVTAPPVLPNLLLREAGLFQPRNVRGRLYPDFHASGAWAMVDHEIAHVYVRNRADIPAAGEALAGAGEILDAGRQAEFGCHHPRSGELMLIAPAGSWLAYPWWTGRREAPDYATHVDIHNKPGFDPCELFFGFPPPSVSQDLTKVRGTHGRTGEGRDVAWAASFDAGEPETVLDLAVAAERFINQDHADV